MKNMETFNLQNFYEKSGTKHQNISTKLRRAKFYSRVSSPTCEFSFSIPWPSFVGLPDHTPLLVYAPVFASIFRKVIQKCVGAQCVNSFE